MIFKETSLPDVFLIVPQVYGDERGFFMETFNLKEFRTATGINPRWCQDNHSGSRQNILRGMHYQLPHAQGKLVRVVAGEVFDVAVDIRRNSPHFGKWVGEYISADNKKQLWIPPGFAHGFYVVSPFAEFVYKATNFYHPEVEGGLNPFDPEVAINWPILSGHQAIVNDRDRLWPNLSDINRSRLYAIKNYK